VFVGVQLPNYTNIHHHKRNPKKNRAEINQVL